MSCSPISPNRSPSYGRIYATAGYTVPQWPRAWAAGFEKGSVTARTWSKVGLSLGRETSCCISRLPSMVSQLSGFLFFCSLFTWELFWVFPQLSGSLSI